MDDNYEKGLNDFLDSKEENEETKKNVILKDREGLIERVDKIFITPNGKMLLREQY